MLDWELQRGVILVGILVGAIVGVGIGSLIGAPGLGFIGGAVGLVFGLQGAARLQKRIDRAEGNGERPLRVRRVQNARRPSKRKARRRR